MADTQKDDVIMPMLPPTNSGLGLENLGSAVLNPSGVQL